MVGPGLRVLFCGINPGLYSAATGLHFARPGNRFWKVLAAAGLTPRLLAPHETADLLAAGLGITNLVARATAAAAELSADELRAGARGLAAKARRWQPLWVAVVGLGAYRTAFGRPGAAIGPQPERIGPAGIWLLPNTSGLQAHYQLPALTTAFSALAAEVESASRSTGGQPARGQSCDR